MSLTIALAKGRLQDETIRRLAAGGVRVPASELESRRLRVADDSGRFSLLLVKPGDVPVYVEYGVADAGVCGSDVLVESGADVHEPLDLGFGRCRLAVAARAEDASADEEACAARSGVAAALRAAGPRDGAGSYDGVATVRVATKYPRTAAEHFRRKGVPVEIVVLSGSVELAPITGLAERIVDLVESGRTLAENGLVVTETIAEVSARLVVNRASYQLKRDEVAALVALLEGR